MRKQRLFTVTFALVCVLSLTAIGQEEALPPVKRLAVPVAVEPTLPDFRIDLPVEPLVDAVQPPTLASAAEANDYATFDALYAQAKSSGEPVTPYADLHALWTYSVTDPIGAFYGAEMHDRFARVYPGFARYIEEYRIVDQNGRAFYPSAETRRFLLAQVTNATPRVALAEVETVVVRPARNVGETPTSQPARRRRSVVKPQPAPAPPVIVAEQPAPAPVQVPVPAPVIAEAKPIVQAPVPAPAPAPAKPVPTVADESSFTGRGILLLIIGLIGVGVLTVMMRAPKEEDAPPQEAANVEPIRMPQAKTDAPRATGSHG